MKILILGAGGIGGYFGARLMQAGADITFLVRPARRERLREAGLCIETPTERFRVEPTLVCAGDAMPAMDLVLLAPKAYDLDSALADLRSVPGEPVLLPFLNGLDHLHVLDAAVGRARVMGGVAHIAATLGPSGEVRQLSALHQLSFGARHPSQAGVVDAFAALCAGAAFDSRRVDDIEQVLWDKWVFLATLAGLTTLCRGSIGAIVATPYGRSVSQAMYAESCAVAAASGHPIAPATQQQALGMLTQPGSSFTASMLRDLLAGARTEHDHILGRLVERARAGGVETHLLALAHTHLALQAAARST